jgi:SnoaL-like domain
VDDIEQIRQLKARYFRFIDTHDWPALLEVFAPDAEIDTTSEGGKVTRDAAQFVTRLERILGNVVSVHHGHMPEIELISPTQARGVWAMEDTLWWPEGSPIRHLHGYGHYHETYEKVDGRWVITSMRLTRIRRDVEPG